MAADFRTTPNMKGRPGESALQLAERFCRECFPVEHRSEPIWNGSTFRCGDYSMVYEIRGLDGVLAVFLVN